MSYDSLVQDFKFLLNDALTHDETTNGGNQETITKFTDCLEIGLKARKYLEKTDPNYQKLTNLIQNAMTRAEEIKTRINPPENAEIYPKINQKSKSTTPVQKNASKPIRSTMSCKTSPSPQSSSSSPSMTKEEIQLLIQVSTVNNQKYLPFSPNDVTPDKFKTITQFTDRTPLKLSQSMSKIPGVTFESISDLYTNPVIFNENLSAASLKQGSIGDCSLICSMAVSADYEFRRFPKGHPNHVDLFSRIIYPKNAVNTNGKYLVEFDSNV
jgi:hypothetical protein